MSNWVFDAGRVLPARNRRYYDAEELMALPAPAWLVENYIPENSLGVLYGPPKVGKSFLALDWALCLAKGLEWQGCKTDKRGKLFVMYMLGEGVGGIGQRLTAWEQFRGEQIKETPLIFPDKIVNFSNMADAKSFTEDMLDIFEPPPALIIIDTFARAMAGADENSVQDVSQVIAYADAVRQATGSSLLFVHHSTKADEAKERGSSALRGAVDYMIGLRPMGDGGLHLEVEYARDFLPVDPKRLVLKTVANSAVLQDAGLADSVPLSTTQKRIIEILSDSGASGVSVSVLIQALGVAGTTAFRALSDLGERGLVTKQEGKRGKYTLTAFLEN